MTIRPCLPGLSINMQFPSPPITSVPNPAPKVEEKRHRLFWFKKENGEVFCSQEEEAWNILCGRVKVFVNGIETAVKHEYLGASESNLYFDGLKEMPRVFKEQGLEKAQDYLRELERKELETVNKSIRPRNMDKTLNGVPANFQI